MRRGANTLKPITQRATSTGTAKRRRGRPASDNTKSRRALQATRPHFTNVQSKDGPLGENWLKDIQKIWTDLRRNGVTRELLELLEESDERELTKDEQLRLDSLRTQAQQVQEHIAKGLRTGPSAMKAKAIATRQEIARLYGPIIRDVATKKRSASHAASMIARRVRSLSKQDQESRGLPKGIRTLRQIVRDLAKVHPPRK
jgi:hypothetical protein